MLKKLTETEIIFIRDNVDLSVDSIMEKMPEADRREVEILRSHYKPQNQIAPARVNNPDDFNAGNLMQKRNGIVVMTQPASELSDERNKRVKSKKDVIDAYKDKIYVPHPKSS